MFNYQMKIKFFSPQFISCVKYLHQQAQSVSPSNFHEPQKPGPTFPNNHAYKNLYPWTRLGQFADFLLSQTLYSDNDIVAVAKPFGVGIHNPYDQSTQPDKIEPKLFGDPRYCLDDALPLLSQKLNVPDLSVCITEDRIFNGIIVLAKSEKASKRVKRLFSSNKRHQYPVYTFNCLTYGPPIMKEPIVEEKVVIQEMCVNENTGEREPEIFYKFTKNQVKKNNRARTVSTSLKVLDYNTNLNVALVELSCNLTNFHFVRCYLASKACFILGDPRFSRRVGHVLGVPYALKALNKKPREEPLSKPVRKVLNIPGNKSIPLMIHQVKLSLSNYTKNTNLDIENYSYPKHFIWTMNKLLTTKYQ